MDTPTTPAVQSPGLSRRILSWAVRGVMAGALVWVCLWTYQGIAALVRPDSAPEPPAEAKTEPLALLNAQDLTAGAWQFLDSGYEVSAESLSNAEGQRRIVEKPAADLVASETMSQRYAGMLAVLKQQGKVTREGDLWRHLLQHAGFSAVAYTKDEAGRQLVAARWLIPLGGNQYWLVEQTPAKNSPAKSSASETILPKSISSQVLTQRRDGSGHTFCQLLTVQSSLADMIEQFRREGWQVDAPAGAVSSGFVRIYLSRQMENYWLVVSPTEEPGKLSVLLLRDDTTTDVTKN